MKVYSLTGVSGTGKSFQALNLCDELKISAIVDDGLFIYNEKVEAGHSAKREKTKVGAIRTAVFSREEHRAEVARRIRELHPDKILILGTSDAMADKIAAQLELPPVSKRIHIEDIATPEQIRTALKVRESQGKHIIPVPTMQLKRAFSGYFLDPLRIFRGKSLFGGGSDREKTVVRPTYSYLGDFFISENVITDIARCVARECAGIAAVDKVYENMSSEALVLMVQIKAARSPAIWENAAAFQKALAEMVGKMTAFNVVEVNIRINAIVFQAPAAAANP